MPQVVILWTAPRSLSHAFYTSMNTVKSTKIKCLRQLLYSPFHFGPTSTSTVKPDYLPIEPTYNAALHALLKQYPGVDLVFSNELAYTLPPQDSPQYREFIQALEEAKHTFLIRDPAKTGYSLHKALQTMPTHPQYNVLARIGFKEMYDLHNYITKTLGKTAVVINADDLHNDPDKMMKLYCEAIEISFEPHMTTWEAGQVELKPAVNDWGDALYSTVRASTGFIKIPYAEQKPVPLSELSPEMLKQIEFSQPYYEAMLPTCIKPS